LLEPLKSLLGKVPDQQIADRAGVSRALVVNFRKKLGIPAYEGYKFGQEKAASAPISASERGFRGRRSALDSYVHVLGTMPDAEVAKLANVTAENVRTYRHRRGIAANWKDVKPAPRPVVETRPFVEPRAPAPKKAPSWSPAVTPVSVPAPPAPATSLATTDVPVAASGSGTAFLVVVDTEQGPRNYALVAADIASAAGVAQQRVSARHPNASIRSIQRVAELLP
jgi:hypothetical protein